MNVIERLISVMAPFECLMCGLEGAAVCTNCRPLACPAIPPRCYRCYTATNNYAVCQNCRSSSSIRHVLVRTELAGLPRQLLHLFKFERAQALAPTIAAYMGEVLGGAPNLLVVPVPTATNRLRERGYDHARLLAKQLALMHQLTLESALMRLNQTRQVGTKRATRLTQLRGAFRLSRPESVVGARVLLVDDVITTGATLEEAARTLKQAGARSVDAIVFAQKQ